MFATRTGALIGLSLDAGVVVAGEQLDALIAATDAFCTAPEAGAATALLGLTAEVEGIAAGLTGTRAAVVLVGERCPDDVATLVDASGLVIGAGLSDG